LAICKKIDPNLNSLGVIQILLAGLAGLALYDLGCSLASPMCGVIAATLFLWNPDLSRWHFYVLTESVYISCVILFVWSLSQFIEKPSPSLARVSLLVLATLVTASVRPNGWFLVPIAFGVWIHRTFDMSGKRWALLLGSVFLFCIGLSFTWRTLAGIQYAIHPASYLRQGVVIWGFPSWNLSMPKFPAATSSLWTGDLKYDIVILFSCLRLGLVRIFVEILHGRPFYSRLHNVAIALYLAPVYVFAMMGYTQSKLPLLKACIAWVIAAQLLVIALVCADWDGRFLLYILPLVSLLAAISLSQSLENLILRR
jgi:hypothetical protein